MKRNVHIIYLYYLILVKGGAIINCDKGQCKKAFHPECARRAKYFLDVRENENCQQVLMILLLFKANLLYSLVIISFVRSIHH